MKRMIIKRYITEISIKINILEMMAGEVLIYPVIIKRLGLISKININIIIIIIMKKQLFPNISIGFQLVEKM